ncbi:MAG: secretin N-terminal domain-containing protein [Limisphaerales bacterium]
MKTRILFLGLGLLLATTGRAQNAGGNVATPPAPLTNAASRVVGQMRSVNSGETSAAAPTSATVPQSKVAVPVFAPPANANRPSAQPIQPVIPGFDPTPFLQAEEEMMEVITNTAPEDEIILELKYDDIELIELIKSLAVQADLNVLFDPAVIQQTPTDPNDPNVQPARIVPAFRMSNVTAKQALEAILENYQMQMIHDPKTNTYRVTNKTAQQQDPVVTRIITLKYSSPTNFLEVLNAVVSPPGQASRGSVTAYNRTQQLIITATEDQWDMVNQLLDQLDTPVKQVLIEANILETSRNPQTLRGIDWSGTLQNQNVGFGNGRVEGTITQTRPGATTTTTQTLPSGRTVTSSQTAKSQINETITSTLGGLAPGLNLNTRDGFSPSTAYLSADGVRAVLSFLNSDTETEVIATPRAVMMDGDKARLEVTRAFPIFEITPGSAQSPAGSTVTYTNMGTILEVTPVVQANNNIALRVTPEVSNIDGQDTQTINGAVNQANIYAIRRINTHVMVPSGFTLVMGGLINDTKTTGNTKVPLLGDIPGLGWAFRRESKIQRKQNLIIFITPTIIEQQHFQAPQTDFLHGENQPTADDFLNQRMQTQKPKPEQFMDSAKPAEWQRKPKKGGFFKWYGR